MHLGKSTKILIGSLTAFLSLYPVVVIPVAMRIFLSGTGFPNINPVSLQNSDFLETTWRPLMLVLSSVSICYSIVLLGLQIFYIYHQIKNKVLTDTSRTLYVIGVLLLPYIAMPVYFFAQMWQDGSRES